MKRILILLFPVVAAQAQAQDTNIRSLQTVTITHQLYKKQDDIIDIKKVANPITIIDKKMIRMMGSRRLDEVLREQTGMAMVNDLGAGNRSLGIQMQGFSSEYILILINGQPMTGRFNGNFDISRISVSDIERIEVIKGAASSLYGSEAMGGVINIITKQTVTDPQATASLQYGTYNTLDATLQGETPFNRGSVNISGSYYKTDGFNVNTQYLKEGTTSPPYHSINLQGRAHYKLSDKSSLYLSSRLADRHSVMDRSYGAQPFSDQLDEKDFNTALSLNTNLANGWRLLGRYYITHYKTEQAVNIVETGKELQRNVFSQVINRLELQAGKDFLSDKLSFTGGLGGDHQQMIYNMYNYFGYAQLNYTPSTRYSFIAGLRYDGNNVYGGKLNPSLGATWSPAAWVKIKTSLGKGFKSPTYAQMYQVFTNITQGYTVIGANNFEEKIVELQKAGLVQQVWANAAGIRDLQPETSTSFNFGVKFSFARTAELDINGFYNKINNLINTEQVGISRNGQQIFSYFNLRDIYTTGVEAGLKYSPLKRLTIAIGYQYLIAKNSTIIDSIKGRHSTVRTPEGIRTASTSDYFGLPNRSKHMLNAQIYYEFKPWGITASLRVGYRGKYGFLDIDNNGYIDKYDVFVNGYTLLHAAIQKSLFREMLTLRLSVDNITNHTDYLMPSQPGRILMGGFIFNLRKNSVN
ncbi:TonB-dependent receptor [Chitinophaga sp. SYP-B3965]|uniref:TonB-dependent receptor plug domain-containing protein n=1 Tax=Chitinophaga sp. SYP-B3965 TaxID=2663120 RepID=UPI001299FACE|nr:TonB-dependent receptor [Chitinophaga sp. SYP-B3965]MRG48949.1 TonB-dependent receptor [Chitinophaga sp. SYP-B3965]